jgi:alkyl hydroperoxide reductase subunit AhpC
VIPQLRAWHENYAAAGLTIVGVHTPEAFWEKPYGKVVAAAKRLKISYPVVQDNDYAIWKRFGAWAWPTAIVVDRKGVIRYRHIGEGAYQDTEAVLRKLLSEDG